MWNTIIDEDPTVQILSAWIVKGELRTLLSTVRIGGDTRLTRHRLHRFLTWCIDSQIPELLTLAATIDTRWPDISAGYDSVAPANGRQQPRLHACPVKIEDDI
jgi:transposase